MAPPAGNGTMSVTGRVGQPCARASCGATAVPTPAATRNLRRVSLRMAFRRCIQTRLSTIRACVDRNRKFLQAVDEKLRGPAIRCRGASPMIRTKGILHITIPVSDLARSRAFYTEVLGLEFVGQAPKENPHFVFLKSGGDYVVLGRETRHERFSDIIHHAFMVDGDAYEATVAELKAKGVDVFREDERHEGVFTGRSAYFHDPDNNALEVIHLTNTAKR